MPDALRDEAVRTMIARGASVIDANQLVNAAVKIGEEGAAETEPPKRRARRSEAKQAEEVEQAYVNRRWHEMKDEFLQREAARRAAA